MNFELHHIVCYYHAHISEEIYIFQIHDIEDTLPSHFIAFISNNITFK